MKKEFKNKEILLTRDRNGNRKLAKVLGKRGARVICWESFRYLAVPPSKKLQNALHRLDRFDWIVFTSPRAAEYLIGPIGRMGPIRRGGDVFPRVAVVGPATAKVVRSFGLKVSLVSRVASSKGLASENVFKKTKGLKIFFPRARDALGDFERILCRRHRIVSCVVYRKEFVRHTKAQIQKLLSRKIDEVAFYSPSAVKALYRELGNENFFRLVGQVGRVRRVRVKTIGPTTAQQLKACLKS